MAQNFNAGRRAVEVDVPAQTRAIDQLLGGGANGFEAPQTGGERSGEVGGGGLRTLGRLGQQKPGLQIGQPGGHDEVIGGQFQAHAAGDVNEFKILINQSEDGDLLQIHLLAAGELQQKIERPFKPIDIDEESRLGFRLLDLRLELQLNRHGSLSNAQAGLPSRRRRHWPV